MNEAPEKREDLELKLGQCGIKDVLDPVHFAPVGNAHVDQETGDDSDDEAPSLTSEPSSAGSEIEDPHIPETQLKMRNRIIDALEPLNSA